MVISRTIHRTQIQGREIVLSNLQKVLYPKASFTKAEVIEYYRAVSSYMLPYLENRVLTLKRYPNGVEKEFFYEKQCPVYRPPWIKTAKMKTEHKDANFCQIDSLAGIVWVVNLASLEFHTLLSTADNFEKPTLMVFDLDPGEPAGMLDCCRVALMIKDLLKHLKLEAFIKTSGGKGLHVYVPLNTSVSFAETKSFSRQVALTLENHDPLKITANMKKALRHGKVFVDWSQNDRHKTTVCVYSLRAKERPTVSMPLEWKEVKEAAQSRKKVPLTFEAGDVLPRLKKKGDLFKPLLTLKQKLPLGGLSLLFLILLETRL